MNKYQARFVESVLKKVISGKYRKIDAHRKLGYSRPYIDELIEKYKKDGYSSLIHKNTRRAPINKIDFNKANLIVSLYKEKYDGFNFTHFKEMLFEYENISISYCSLYRLLKEVGIQSPKHQKIRHKENLHPSRPRRSFFGELIQIDGSIHLWFGEQKYTLHAAIDDATSAIVGAFFDKEETLFGYYMMFKQILMTYGIPQEFYSDRKTIFEYRKRDENDKVIENDTFTQFKRCCNQLGVEIHTTSVSQAKGRVERLFGTLQDRLISEMRLNKVKTVEDANEFVTNFVTRHNNKFAIPIDYNTSLFAPPPKEYELDFYLSKEYERTVDNGSVISIKGQKLQFVDENGIILALPGKTKVSIYETLDGRFVGFIKDEYYETVISTYKKETILEIKKERKPWTPPPNHPWRRFMMKKKR